MKKKIKNEVKSVKNAFVTMNEASSGVKWGLTEKKEEEIVNLIAGIGDESQDEDEIIESLVEICAKADKSIDKGDIKDYLLSLIDSEDWKAIISYVVSIAGKG